MAISFSTGSSLTNNASQLRSLPGGQARNSRQTSLDWQFTTADANTKLARLDPSIDDSLNTMFGESTIHVYLNPATGAFWGIVSLVLILVALRVSFLKGNRRLNVNDQTLWQIYNHLPFGIMLQDRAGVILYQNLIAAGLMESAEETDLISLLQRRAQAERPHMDIITLPVQPPRRVSVRTIPLDDSHVVCVLTDLGYQKRGEAIYRALFHQLSTPIASLFLHHDLLQEVE